MPRKPVTDHTFAIGAGRWSHAGKVHWPALLRLEIPQEKAFEFALDILNRLRNQPVHTDETDEIYLDVALFGELKENK
jgi:hypothetical protein